MNWELIKDNANQGFLKAARFFLYQNIVMYFFACILAREPLWITGYIEFLNHCCKWAGR